MSAILPIPVAFRAKSAHEKMEYKRLSDLTIDLFEAGEADTPEGVAAFKEFKDFLNGKTHHVPTPSSAGFLV